MKPARGLCVSCLLARGVSVSVADMLGEPALGGIRVLTHVCPENPASLWVEADGWIWCWGHGARRVRLATLVLLESGAA